MTTNTELLNAPLTEPTAPLEDAQSALLRERELRMYAERRIEEWQAASAKPTSAQKMKLRAWIANSRVAAYDDALEVFGLTLGDLRALAKED